ncbi:LysR family transcriptional regulator [Blautia schinkii]|nr:LysR family transcriptional regulator [Blautia schinkii]
MTIFQTECFLAVAEYLNFAKAARQMNISQPAMTRQIQSLEEELGTKLFNRSTRNVSLTVEGNSLLTDAHIIVGTSKRVLSRFQKQDEEKIVDFHISYSSASHIELLKNALEELKNTYPFVHPWLHILPGSQVADAVFDETIDIALTYRFSKPKSALIFRELKKVPYICVCRKDCPIARLDIVSVEDLSPYPMIMHDPGNMPSDVIAEQWEWAGDKKPSMLYFTESAEASMLLASAGFGVTVVPNICVPSDRNLATCELNNPKQISFGLYYKTGRESPWLKTFVTLMKKL